MLQILETTGWLLRRPMAPRTPMTVPNTVAMKASCRVRIAPSTKDGHRSRMAAKSRLRFIPICSPSHGRLIGHSVVDPEQSLIAVRSFAMGTCFDVLARHQCRTRKRDGERKRLLLNEPEI